MACDTKLKPRQTISQRKTEVSQAKARLDALISGRQVKVVINPQGNAFLQGWSDQSRDGVTDGCALRMLLSTGSVTAKAEIARAEMLSGRKINRQALGLGVHSHDQGLTWHTHKA